MKKMDNQFLFEGFSCQNIDCSSNKKLEKRRVLIQIYKITLINSVIIITSDINMTHFSFYANAK